jgi:hypothetical protein
MKKPRILISTHYNCLRNIKSSIAAYNLGYELELITQGDGLGLVRELMHDHIYKSIRIWSTPSQLEKYMEESNADIIWCHNEPDLMTVLAHSPNVKRDRMIIHDCHDLPTLHPEYTKNEEVNEQEMISMTKSDMVFVPTQDYVDITEKKYGRKEGVHVLYSCAPSAFFPNADMPRVNGMLYCGQINVPSMGSRLAYRDVVPLFRYLTALGIASHIYYTTPNIDVTPYITAGACTYGVLKMWAAIQQYTRYDYGFVGSNVECEEIKICMPNKLFDCMAAGIPLICLNADTAGKFCIDNDIGISVNGLSALQNVPWGDVSMWERMRKNVREIRREYTMENQLKKLFDKVGI